MSEQRSLVISEKLLTTLNEIEISHGYKKSIIATAATNMFLRLGDDKQRMIIEQGRDKGAKTTVTITFYGKTLDNLSGFLSNRFFSYSEIVRGALHHIFNHHDMKGLDHFVLNFCPSINSRTKTIKINARAQAKLQSRSKGLNMNMNIVANGILLSVLDLPREELLKIIKKGALK